MSEKFEWLPSRIEFDDYDGNWFRYLDVIYQVYLETLVLDRASFQGKIVLTIKEPQRDNKEETFWHIIEGKIGNKVETDFDRCASVPWIRPTIDATREGNSNWWISSRTKKGKRRKLTRLVIALNDFSYKIILNIRKANFLLITAYPISDKHTQRKIKREYEEWQKK